MELAGVHHVAICVDDVDKAIDFYVDVLGCHVREDRPDFGFPGAWLDAGSQQIHLMQFAEDPKPKGHYALRVDDAEGWAAHLESKSVKHMLSPHIEGAGRQVFLADPSGNQIELNQPDH
ncbi:MAG TPA: VOC family protein [Acidimicrobiia bacterium]|jgi:catechol 2,3-dioxygenase-like lactoylglutathione lyase family enzyme